MGHEKILRFSSQFSHQVREKDENSFFFAEEKEIFVAQMTTTTTTMMVKMKLGKHTQKNYSQHLYGILHHPKKTLFSRPTSHQHFSLMHTFTIQERNGISHTIRLSYAKNYDVVVVFISLPLFGEKKKKFVYAI
jgi:hypothetical protein